MNFGCPSQTGALSACKPCPPVLWRKSQRKIISLGTHGVKQKRNSGVQNEPKIKDLYPVEEELYGKQAPKDNGISAHNWDSQTLT